MLIGFFQSKRRKARGRICISKTAFYKSDRTFWALALLNCIMCYSVVYETASMTPRYKLIYLIPMMFFACRGLIFLKRKVIVRRKVFEMAR